MQEDIEKHFLKRFLVLLPLVSIKEKKKPNRKWLC